MCLPLNICFRLVNVIKFTWYWIVLQSCEEVLAEKTSQSDLPPRLVVSPYRDEPLTWGLADFGSRESQDLSESGSEKSQDEADSGPGIGQTERDIFYGYFEYSCILHPQYPWFPEFHWHTWLTLYPRCPQNPWFTKPLISLISKISLLSLKFFISLISFVLGVHNSLFNLI